MSFVTHTRFSIYDDIYARRGRPLGPVDDDHELQHRHFSYMRGKRKGFLWGVTWTVKTLGWIGALSWLIWYTDWS